VPERIRVVGMVGDRPVAPVEGDLVIGGRRHLAGITGHTLAIEGDVDAVLDAVAAEPGTVCVLASGDPGFFGIVRPLAARYGPDRLEVQPGLSAVALAFARLGLSWDDATVVSAHGRPLAEAAPTVVRARKAAVLVSPDCPPEALGKELLALGCGPRDVAVCERLALPDERIVRTDLDGLAGGRFDPLSVVVVLADDGVPSGKTLRWGRPDEGFSHRAGMVTKAEVRAVALGKLDLPPTGVLWDVGAGSGSVAVECAALVPGLDVYAVERRPDDVARISENAAAHDARVTVVEGEAPDVLVNCPDPDRAFVGGGGLAVLDAVLARLRPGGTVVAAYAALDRAVAAADRLGNLVQVGVARGGRLPDGAWRLVAENPVFVTWGTP
jgi:precorrin-6Y C5,15-methyltransferase (decarboxylating)